MEGKKVAVIGTGATKVQIGQTWAKEAAETFIFQRTPNTCLPMRQEKLDPADHQRVEKCLAAFATTCTTVGGLPYGDVPLYAFEDTPEQREATYERIYQEGGLRLWNGTYRDVM